MIATARVRVFDERSRFDTFVVGDATRDAVDAARVAAAAQARWNPLVIRGASGLGKSHLLGAVALHARAARPDLRVVALSAVYGAASIDGARVDLLLVDDLRPDDADQRDAAALHAVAAAAIAAGRQVVIAEDGALASSHAGGTRWIARYPHARIVALGVPDEPTRRAIVRQAAHARALGLTPDALDALDALAREPAASARALLGRLTRLAERAGVAGVQTGAPNRQAGSADADFASFLDEVAREVAQQIEPWRMQLGEAAARWRDEGIDVAVLERALRLARAPDVRALVTTFEAAVARLDRARRRAAAIDPSLAGHAAFRDPSRVGEAEALVRGAAAGSAVPNGGGAAASPAFVVDDESWTREWPDMRDLLIEGWP